MSLLCLRSHQDSEDRLCFNQEDSPSLKKQSEAAAWLNSTDRILTSMGNTGVHDSESQYEHTPKGNLPLVTV